MDERRQDDGCDPVQGNAILAQRHGHEEQAQQEDSQDGSEEAKAAP